MTHRTILGLGALVVAVGLGQAVYSRLPHSFGGSAHDDQTELTRLSANDVAWKGNAVAAEQPIQLIRDDLAPLSRHPVKLAGNSVVLPSQRPAYLTRNSVVLPSQRPAYLAGNSVVLPSQRPAYLAANRTALTSAQAAEG